MIQHDDSKSEKHVSVIGCGRWGRNLVRNFQEMGALHSIADRDEGRLADFAKENGYPVNSIESILQSDAVSAVAIATNSVSHADLARRCIEAGKHVLVEKPLALSVDDSRALCRLAEEKNRILMVGHVTRYHPAFRQLQEMLRNGDLGQLRYLASTRLNFGRFRVEEDALWSFAPHDVSMFLALAGDTPAEVVAVGRNYLTSRIADVTTLHMSFSDGVSGHIHVSWLHPFKEQRLVVVGEDAMAVFDDNQPWEKKLTVYRHKVIWTENLPTADAADAEPVPCARNEPLRAECEHFLDCIRTGARPETDGEEGHRVLSVLDAAARSMADGQPVRVRHEKDCETMIHPTATVDNGCMVGDRTRIWHYSHLMDGAKVGEDCIIGQNVFVGPGVTIGNGCKIQNDVNIYDGVTLEDDVFCGPGMTFTNVSNPRAFIEKKATFEKTVVKRGATIGANATIVSGVTLGEYCFVAAGAVVTKDVVPLALVANCPARQIGWVSHAGERLDDSLTCPRTGDRYQVGDDGQLVKIERS